MDQRLEEHVWGVDIGSHSQLRAQVIQYSITAHNLRTYCQLVSILVQHQPKAIHNARCREMTRWQMAPNVPPRVFELECSLTRILLCF